ncbi:DUF6077 domain-containing protein [Nocardioides cheoyonin]|uniref:DUF6077 domain-containing protein n=1 Tax=Nocardioides cheoyonin TaxID=3156615 RepID=UPI0032B580CD
MRPPRGLTAWIDRAYDVGVVVFAAWTIAYHVCLALRLGVPWAWAVTAVCLIGWWLVQRRLPDTPSPDSTIAPSYDGTAAHAAARPLLRREWTAVLTVLAAVVTAFGMAFSAPWSLVWIGWLVTAVIGTLTAWRWLRRPAEPPGDTETLLERWSPVIALGWAIGIAVVSLWTMSPSGDDVYYVNLSQWVASHGEFPIRDTLFADLEYPMSNWPPVASYDALVGAVAALVGAKAGTIAYLVVTPVASFLAVLGLWRLLRAWRVRPAIVALSVVLLGLLAGSDAHHTAGGGLVVRIWQGKFIFAWVLIPWLLVHLVRYFDRPSRRQLLSLFAGGTAAVGLSTTGIFVVPVMALAGSVPLLRRSWRQACACFAATAVYPIGAGLVTKALGGRSADLFGTRKLYRFDADHIGHSFFATGPYAVVLVLAVLLGVLLIPHRGARVTTGVMALALGVVFVPGVTHLSYDVVGLGPTIRRIKHGLDFVALVGVTAVWLGTLLRRWRGLGLAVVALAATVFFAAYGTPMRAQVSTWQRPFHWQRLDDERVAVARLVRAGPLHGPLLAPTGLSVTTALTTTSIKAVVPRDYYMDYLRDDPTFHYDQRHFLGGFVNSAGPWDRSGQRTLDHALAVVHVGVACVFAGADQRARALVRAGFSPFFVTPRYRCFHHA